MNVIVPTPTSGCPAHLALLTEGVLHAEYLCTGRFSYGRVFSHFWNEAAPFIIVEHDIVPWPGAVSQLEECSKPWCTFPYPTIGPGDPVVSFGIGKYRPDGPAPDDWAKTTWDMLDGAVIPVLKERLGQPHVHEPAVAHARRP